MANLYHGKKNSVKLKSTTVAIAQHVKIHFPTPETGARLPIPALSLYTPFHSSPRKSRLSEHRLLRHHPKSFLKLILVGFLLVALPLFLALAYSALSIDRLANQSRQAVYQAERIAHGSRILVDQVAAMERSIRLSLILGDATLLEGYYQAHDRFTATSASLATLPLKDDQRALLDKLQATESAIFMKIGDARNSPAGLTASTVDFTSLLDSARSFLNKGDAPIEHEVDAMQAMAARARTIVIWQLLALVPVAILLASGFSLLINRPIRQIDEAIRIMGQGELSQSIIVEGPQDLTRLGERLDWMRRRLLDLEAQKTRFLQHVSHELKTPLTSIREGADLLAAGVTGSLNAKQMQVARILLGNSVELQKRIEDLLNYSAIQSGSTVTARQRADLQQILDAVLHDQTLAIMNKSLQIDLNCPSLPLECDEQKIRIAVDNLLSNAVKHSPNGGKIRILAQKTQNDIVMDIIDSGPGVAPDDRDRIFDPFYQGRKPSHSPTSGTGLGLSIAREYVKAQGGTLALMDGEAGGAHFRIILPDTCGAAS